MGNCLRESLSVHQEKTDRYKRRRRSLSAYRRLVYSVTSETLRRKAVVHSARFNTAILLDLSRERDREDMGLIQTEGLKRYAGDDPVSVWTSLADAVSVCTRGLRAAGLYPETVLAAIKSAVRQAAASLVSLPTAETMIRAAGQACIAAYFDLSLSDLRATPAHRPVSIPNDAATPASGYGPRSRPIVKRETVGWELPHPQRSLVTR